MRCFFIINGLNKFSIIRYKVIILCAIGIIFFTNTVFSQTVWSEDWEGNWVNDWHVDAGTWEVGTPTSGPNSAYDGLNCAATVLNGNYSEPVDTRLIRHTSFVVPPASENPRIRFWYWFSFNSSSDWGEIQIKTNSGVWESISNVLNSQGGDVWSYGSIDISSYADSTVQIAFHFHSINDGGGSIDVSSGWYIDDVSLVTGPYVFNNPEDFELGFGDWSADEGSWEIGVPTVGPGSAHGGQNCAGTKLDGNYQEPSDSRLVSPPFVVPPASENPRIRFWYWFSFNSSSDWGEIQIKTNSGVWESISNVLNSQGGDVWSYGSIDISSYADSTVQIAFHFHSINDGGGSIDVSSGWYIDDVSLVTGPYIFNNPEDFELGFGDWSADEGSWEIGVPTVGPGSAHGGQNCAGTKLDGNYQEPSDSRLVSPPFVVPPASENPGIQFWQWFSFNSSSDWGEVQISTDGGITWVIISSRIINTSSGIWSNFFIPLAAYADYIVQIAFHFHSINDGGGSIDVSSGWFIDDVKITPSLVGVESNLNSKTPQSYQLSQNYPNPFNPSTIIQYAISIKQFVTLKIFDVLGKEVAILVNEEKPAGNYEVEFDGSGITSGVYFYKVQAGTFVETKKMIYLK